MTITALSDTELLAQARGGDEAAFTELYVRHQAAARRLASTYKRLGDPDDLVNGAFERVLGALRRGAGPTESFRAYLFVTLRRLAAEQGQRPADQTIEDVPEPVSHEAEAPELAGADRELITKAFETLPDRWQAVLWHTAVEGRRPRELAAVLGVSANAAAAMAYRAREKLRQAYLQAHLAAAPAPEHEPYRSQLGAYVRDGLSARDKAAVDRHLSGCDSCRALVAELEDVNRVLVRSVVPLFMLVGGGKLALAGAGALAAAGTAAGSGSGSSASGPVGRGTQKLRQLAPIIGSVAAIAAVIAGSVGIGALVSRGSGGPLDSASDATDIGPTGPPGSGAGGAGSGGGAGAGSGSDRSGAPGGSVEPPAGAGPGGGSGSAPLPTLSGPAGGGPGPVGAAAVPPLLGPPATSPTPPASPSPPPTGPPSTTPTTPTEPPTPTPLAFNASTWLATAVGRGDLDVTIGERGAGAAQVALAAAVQVTPAAEQLRLQVTLTSGARAFPEAPLDSGCTAAGTTITCTLTQPPNGGSAQFSFPLQIDGAGQTASLTLFRGTKVESTVPDAIALSPFEEGLELSKPAWKAIPGIGGETPAGHVSAGATNTGDHTMPAPTVTLTIEGDGAFVPPELFTLLPPPDLFDRLPLSEGIRTQLRADASEPLPAGCEVVGWTPPTGDGATWDAVLRGGLPSTIRCTLADMKPHDRVSIDGLLAAVLPVYVNGDGVQEDPTAQVTLALGGTVVGGPLSLPLTVGPPGQPG